jgi:DUF4097 and DUF4098 domain-containing protein YvlB
MKRSSVIGPLILILLGTIFLMKNMVPDLPVLDFLARTWPFILIAWGGLRLIELVWWFSRGRVLPSNGLSGGEWFLVVLLSVFGSGLYMVRNHETWLSNAKITLGGVDLFNDAFEFPISASVQGPKTGKLVIESFRGDAQITGADVTEVRVTGKKSINAGQQAEADRMDKATPVEVVIEGNQVVIRCNQDHASNNRVSDKLEIIVPKSYAIDARGRRGDFDIRDTLGQVDVYSDNAGVRLDNLQGSVKVETKKSDIIRATQLKGSLELRGKGTDLELGSIQGNVVISGSYSGTVELRDLSKPVRLEMQQMQFTAERIPGEIRSTLSELVGSNIVGPIRISASRGRDVKLTDFTQSLEVDVARGDITLLPGNLPLGKMSVKTRSGDIDLELPEQAKFDLKGVTTHGEATNAWGDDLKSESGKHGSTLAGVVGQGPALILGTDRGGFTIRKLSPEHKEAAEQKEQPERKEAAERKEAPERKDARDHKDSPEPKKLPVTREEE